MCCGLIRGFPRLTKIRLPVSGLCSDELVAAFASVRAGPTSIVESCTIDVTRYKHWEHSTHSLARHDLSADAYVVDTETSSWQFWLFSKGWAAGTYATHPHNADDRNKVANLENEKKKEMGGASVGSFVK